MYEPGPSEDELKAIGLEREDVRDNSVFEVWADNWVPYRIFAQACTQWRYGPGGPTGLDYTAVKWLMDIGKLRKKERADALYAIQVMEDSALNEMNKKDKG